MPIRHAFPGNFWVAFTPWCLLGLFVEPTIAQTYAPTQPPKLSLPTVPDRPQAPPFLPPPLKPLTPPPAPTPQPPEEIEGLSTIRVKRFVFKGNTIFSNDELTVVTAPFLGREVSFAELLQARDAVTDLYVSKGYTTSGAFIPVPENKGVLSKEGLVTIQVVEGKVEDVIVTGSDRLRNYVRSRLKAATSPILNQNRLFEALQLLQVDPLIQNISAELAAGSQQGLTLLNVRVAANQPIRLDAILNNYRSPAVGSLERGVQFSHANLLGLGDRLGLTYLNTDGSNGGAASYAVPFNSNNGTVQFDFSTVSSRVVEPPFSQIDILGDSHTYELTVRQPLIRAASSQSTEEFAVGLTASRQESDSSLLGEPFPTSLGADAAGRTRISALRLFQEYTQQGDQQVLIGRSQFSLGLDILGATDNPSPPDGQFFSWLGQAEYVRRLAPDALLLVRGGLQVADRPLVPIEQLSIGGPQTVRGYRRDQVLANSGALASIEGRIPIFRSSTLPGLQER